MYARCIVMWLVAAVMLGNAAIAGAQVPGERVRVHLLGLRTVEDTVVGMSEDSLFVRHTGPISRNQIVSVDIWRSRSFMRTWTKFGGLGMGAAGIVSSVSADQSAQPGAPKNSSMGPTIAVCAGLGLVAAIVGRVRHQGEWVPSAIQDRPSVADTSGRWGDISTAVTVPRKGERP